MEQNKKQERYTKETLKFMIKTAWQKRPSLFGIYLIMFVAQLMQKVQIVILPKFLMDEIVLIVTGAPVKEHLGTVLFYVGLICGINLVANLLNNVASQAQSVMQEWFDEYFQELLAEHAMKLDFEYTEDPEALNQLNLAKEGIAWYSGGVVGILTSLYNMVSSITVILGVSVVILLTCPLLLPIQIAGLFLIAFFNAKNNAIEIESYNGLAKLNRVFSYVMFQLVDFSAYYERKCQTVSAGTSGTADTVYIVLLILWNIIVKYRFYVIYIDSSCCHIGCYQNICISAAEAIHDTVTQVLLQITVQSFRKVTASLQTYYQIIYLLLRITEYQRQLRAIHIQKTAQYF